VVNRYQCLLTCSEGERINAYPGSSREILKQRTSVLSRSRSRPLFVHAINCYKSTRSPFFFTLTRYSCHVGTSGRPNFISDQFESNCCEACRKYRPSVKRAAESSETIATPADPVNPDMYARRSSHSATYSLWCASSDGITLMK
jgi:hypothetical protein